MTASYSDLLVQKAALERQAAELEKQLAAVRREERSGVIAKIKTLMAEHGLTPADLGPVVGKARKEPNTKGRPVAAKYRDPATGSTWSGRGLKPKWLQAALASGAALDGFAV